MTDAEIAQFLSNMPLEAPVKSAVNIPIQWTEPKSPQEQFSAYTPRQVEEAQLEEKSPLSLVERFLSSFANSRTDPKGLKKYLTGRGYETKDYGGDIYARKGKEGKYGNIDPLPDTLSELGKDIFVDAGDYLTSIPAALGAAGGSAITAATGGAGAPTIPILAGAAAYPGQKLKELIGKKAGVTSEDAPSEASSEAISQGLAALLPMLTSLGKTGVQKVSKAAMGNIVPAMYGEAIGIRDFAKKDPLKAKEIIQILTDNGAWGRRGTLDEIAEKAVPDISSSIDDVLSKSNEKIGWQDIAQKLFKNLEEEGDVIDPVAKKQAVIEWINKIKSKGTDLNKGLFPVGSKKSLVDSEATKRKLNDFVKNFYKQGSQSKITPDQADLAGQTQEIIRDLVRNKSGDPEEVKRLNKLLLAYNTLGKGIEGLEGKEFLNAMGTRASANAFSALAGAEGGPANIAKYKWWKMLLNSLPTEAASTGTGVMVNKLSKINPAIKPSTAALLQFLTSKVGKNIESE